MSKKNEKSVKEVLNYYNSKTLIEYRQISSSNFSKIFTTYIVAIEGNIYLEKYEDEELVEGLKLRNIKGGK